MEKTEGGSTNLYQRTDVTGYSSPAHIFGIDYYEPGSQGEDDFSRREVWFYHCGDEGLKEEFGGRLEQLLLELFIDNTISWDFITLAPAEEKDKVNPNMLEICEDAAEVLGIEYRQVLRRSETITERSEMRAPEIEIEDMEQTIEVSSEVSDQNIVLIDNVSISGLKLAYYTNLLLKAGAKRVFCVTLGVTNHERKVKELASGVTASAVVEPNLAGEEDE